MKNIRLLSIHTNLSYELSRLQFLRSHADQRFCRNFNTRSTIFTKHSYTRPRRPQTILINNYRSVDTLMTPSVSGMRTALFTLSLHPSSLANNTGLRFELNLSLFELGPGLIWAAILPAVVIFFTETLNTHENANRCLRQHLGCGPRKPVLTTSDKGR